MRILVCEEVVEAGVALLRQEHDVDAIYDLSQNELIKIIGGYDALVVRGDTKVTSEVIEAGSNLKVIGRAGVGVEHIDLQAATRRGIVVLNAPQGKSTATIEYTMGMILALNRNIPQAYIAVKEGKWIKNLYTGSELKDKVLGIIGLGRVGKGVAQRAKAFEMKVLAYDPFISEDNIAGLGIDLVDYKELLPKADFLTIHVPYTADTKYLLDEKAFSQMKRGVKIVNCARGGIINEESLLKAMENGMVSGLAIDAFEEEPLAVDHSFLSMPNVICTPHIASWTHEAQNEVAIGVAKGVLAALRAEPVTTSLNIPPVSKSNMETIKPYINLVEKMGVLAVHLAEGRIKSIEIKYNGEISQVDTKMLTLAIIKGVLNPILQEAVNFVNAPEVAKARGITVSEIKSKETENFVGSVGVTVRTDKNEHRVAGTLFGKKEGRVVQIDKYRVDIDPQGWLLIIPHEDYPGMVGKVGTILGENSININSMQVEKTEDIGMNIMIVGVQSDINIDVMNKIKELKGIQSVKKVHFDI